MDLSQGEKDPLFIKADIAYHDTILDNIRAYLKDSLDEMYKAPEEIIEQKENYLEQKQINSNNFESLRQQVANSKQLEQQLQNEQEVNRLINVEKNKLDISNQQLRLKLQARPDYQSLDSDDNYISPERPLPESKSEYQQLMDKINLLISQMSNGNNNNNNNNINNPFNSSIFDEHNKLLMNKRMSDIDEKLYDLSRKFNQKDSYLASPNPFQQIPIIPVNNLVSNPYQQLQPTSVQTMAELKPKSNSDDEDSDEKYNKLLKMIQQLNDKYISLDKSRDEVIESKINKSSVPPVTVNINNSGDHKSEKNQLEPQTENVKSDQEDYSKIIQEQDVQPELNYTFNRNNNPFSYIYNNTDEVSFEKKPVLFGGLNKIEKLKKLRKLK